MSAAQRIGVVSGANRGLGLEISRQLAGREVHVFLTSREEAEGRAAAEGLRGEGLGAWWHALDVTSAESIAALAAHLQGAHGGLDILVNNAGVSFDGFDAGVARDTLAVNFFGALHLTDVLLPLMRAGGRVVMLSSGLGDRSQLSPALRARFDPDRLDRAGLLRLMEQFTADVAAGRHRQQGWPSSAYAVSKIGLNVLVAVLARELRERGDGRGILVNAACPGWVRTRMGGAGAPRSVEEGADTPVWLALLPDDGPKGGVFRDRGPASW